LAVQGELDRLSGNLGAGKTTFVQTLGHKLGISETIQSPTYVLMKTYAINYPPFIQLVHIDAYRLMNPEEFLTLKPERFLNDPHNLVIVEWPEQVEGLLPTPDITMQFSADGAEEEERYIEIHVHA
jgi:tRNA threonylcarbamoyladenosine biosynthesis protein TsaE